MPYSIKKLLLLSSFSALVSTAVYGVKSKRSLSGPAGGWTEWKWSRLHDAVGVLSSAGLCILLIWRFWTLGDIALMVDEKWLPMLLLLADPIACVMSIVDLLKLIRAKCWEKPGKILGIAATAFSGLGTAVVTGAIIGCTLYPTIVPNYNGSVFTTALSLLLIKDITKLIRASKKLMLCRKKENATATEKIYAVKNFWADLGNALSGLVLVVGVIWAFYGYAFIGGVAPFVNGFRAMAIAAAVKVIILLGSRGLELAVYSAKNPAPLEVLGNYSEL